MTKNNSPKFAFWYLLSLVALVFMSFSVGALIFQLINKSIPDIAEFNYQSGVSMELIKFAISALVVSTPIYFWMQNLIFKNLKNGELDKEIGVRKWLTYFILLIAAVVVLGYLIAVINSFLNGELTTKFILKTLTVIAIAAIVFSFYFYDIRRDNIKDTKDKVIMIYFYGSIAIILAALIFAFTMVESPDQARRRRIDQQISNNFSSIQASINNYWLANKKLPDNLQQLADNNSYYLAEKSLVNPSNNQTIEYKVVSPEKYQLCTEFLTASEDKASYDYYGQLWKHQAGYDCVEFTVNNNLKPDANIVP